MPLEEGSEYPDKGSEYPDGDGRQPGPSSPPQTSNPPEGASELGALLIAPDRNLARQFTDTLPETRTFRVLAELAEYPSRPALESQMEQVRPEVVLIDLGTNLDQAAETIGWITASSPSIPVIGLHARKDPEAVIRSLRQGATEFLCAPFDLLTQREALSRVRRLTAPPASVRPDLGRVLAFSSAKSGSGASLLATQVSFALHRLTKDPVLVADMDLMNRTATFYLGLVPGLAQSQTGKVPAGDWTSRVMAANGVEALPAPAASGGVSEASLRPRELLERTRPRYAWIILDLPSVFHRSSLVTLLESDRAFLVTTPELPSLHLTRRAVGLLGQLGFGRERLDVLLNRVEKRQNIEASDVAAIFNVTVRRSFPNDCLAVERALALGEPLGAGCELGSAVEGFASSLAADARAGRLETAARPVGAEARA